LVIAVTILCFDSATALIRIKSKTASGDGCPSEYWVAANADPDGEMRIRFPDLGPQVSHDQAQAAAAKSCRVVLELEGDRDLPGVRFYLRHLAHEAEFHRSWYSSEWETIFAADVQLGENSYRVSDHRTYLPRYIAPR